jgi:hypothetical protein
MGLEPIITRYRNLTAPSWVHPAVHHSVDAQRAPEHGGIDRMGDYGPGLEPYCHAPFGPVCRVLVALLVAAIILRN